MKGVQKKQHLRSSDFEERKLVVKEFYRKHANSLRKKTASRSEAELQKLGGKKEVILIGENRRQTRIVFGGEGETRFIFTLEGTAWMIALEGNPPHDDLKSELNKSGRKLWNASQPEQKPDVGEDKQKERPDIAFQAVEALLTCSRDWQDFSALPESEQEKAELYRAMVNVQLAILTTLQALERDVKNESQKLQLAFELLKDFRMLCKDSPWPNQIGTLRNHALDLACDLQRPPSKKELKDQFDPPKPPHHPFGLVRPSKFSTLSKAAGLSWLKPGKRDQGLP